MTGRDLVKALEACDLDKQVAIIVEYLGENEEGMGVLLRDITKIIENKEVIGIE